MQIVFIFCWLGVDEAGIVGKEDVDKWNVFELISANEEVDDVYIYDLDNNRSIVA